MISNDTKKNLCAKLGANLSTIRAKTNMSQDELASALGLTRQTITAIETNRRIMQWNTFICIILFFIRDNEIKSILELLGIYTNEIKASLEIEDSSKLLKRYRKMKKDENYENAVLPIYLVFETVKPMKDCINLDFAARFIHDILDNMEDSSVLANKIRLEVISFDEEAKIELALADLKGIGEWYAKLKENPLVPNSDNRFYGKAFEKLYERINEGVRQIQSNAAFSGSNGQYQVHRPVVFFIVSGEPNDDANYRNIQYSNLTDDNFEHRPNIICIGVGETKYETLNLYGAGRHGYDRYMIKNHNLVIVSSHSKSVFEDPSRNFSEMIDALIQSIVISFNETVDYENAFDIFGSSNVNPFESLQSNG